MMGVCCFGCFNSIEVQKDGSGNMTLEWKWKWEANFTIKHVDEEQWVVWMKNNGLCGWRTMGCVDEEQWVVWMFHANKSSKRWKWKEKMVKHKRNIESPPIWLL